MLKDNTWKLFAAVAVPYDDPFCEENMKWQEDRQRLLRRWKSEYDMPVVIQMRNEPLPWMNILLRGRHKTSREVKELYEKAESFQKQQLELLGIPLEDSVKLFRRGDEPKNVLHRP